MDFFSFENLAYIIEFVCEKENISNCPNKTFKQSHVFLISSTMPGRQKSMHLVFGEFNTQKTHLWNASPYNKMFKFSKDVTSNFFPIPYFNLTLKIIKKISKVGIRQSDVHLQLRRKVNCLKGTKWDDNYFCGFCSLFSRWFCLN